MKLPQPAYRNQNAQPERDSTSPHRLLDHPLAKQAIAAFRQQYGREPLLLARAPGRVNLLGAHVDYNQGWVLPAAIDRSVWLAAAPLSGPRVTISSLDYGQTGGFQLTAATPSQPVDFPWLRYPLGVAWALQQAGHGLSGMEALLASDLPRGAGVSSSAALEMVLVLAWQTLSGLRLTPLERARLGQKAENEFLGVGSGIMDQFASVYGAADHMILLDCRTLEHQWVPVPAGTAIIVADSGVQRSLASINYNDRPQQCQQALRLLQDHLPGIRALRDVSLADFESHAHRLPLHLRRRARHAIEECQRVLDGAAALRRGDLAVFGQLVRQSQISSRDNYENSIPELDLLAASAWQVSGCYGARFAGGGFGGVMQVLADEAAVPAVEQAMSDAFGAEFGRPLSLFTCKIADGAEVIELAAGVSP